jgi:hypothetical protein
MKNSTNEFGDDPKKLNTYHFLFFALRLIFFPEPFP